MTYKLMIISGGLNRGERGRARGAGPRGTRRLKSALEPVEDIRLPSSSARR